MIYSYIYIHCIYIYIYIILYQIISQELLQSARLPMTVALEVTAVATENQEEEEKYIGKDIRARKS